jgi:hypothetical protein
MCGFLSSVISGAVVLWWCLPRGGLARAGVLGSSAAGATRGRAAEKLPVRAHCRCPLPHKTSCPHPALSSLTYLTESCSSSVTVHGLLHPSRCKLHPAVSTPRTSFINGLSAEVAPRCIRQNYPHNTLNSTNSTAPPYRQHER